MAIFLWAGEKEQVKRSTSGDEDWVSKSVSKRHGLDITGKGALYHLKETNEPSKLLNYHQNELMRVSHPKRILPCGGAGLPVCLEGASRMHPPQH